MISRQERIVRLAGKQECGVLRDKIRVQSARLWPYNRVAAQMSPDRQQSDTNLRQEVFDGIVNDLNTVMQASTGVFQERSLERLELQEESMSIGSWVEVRGEIDSWVTGENWVIQWCQATGLDSSRYSFDGIKEEPGWKLAGWALLQVGLQCRYRTVQVVV